ncbi:efflux RND transporter permease subunit [Waltera acetigignens]|uniref:efflux RND transporter permease subunit n=1 Tax=Waltera acetigignens TaxID=2981769 RepID=UPI0021D3B293|nr:MMPL family transporter [Brotolimicola acetigignens]MCU6759340.1 MMPL family transporter [Brotolimicola acetigignens]
MKFGKWVVKCRIPILILAVALLVPSLIGMIMTRINYDMLTYLPGDIDTVVGQDILMDEFGKGAFSFVIIEGMDPKDVSSLREDISHVDHVDTVLWYDDFADVSVPMEILPSKLYDAFNSGDSTMLAIFFDTSTSSDDTMEAITAIRSIAGKQCFVSGMSAMVTDLKDLCEKEEPIYVGIAVALACVAMMIFMDNWITPFVFLMSIGMAILLNMGTNYFLGEISYLTKALSAVLQLAVTMDYSIFLWHSYEEQKSMYEDNKEAMAVAINNTLTSVVGSSITTVAGFIALCFMSYTLGLDLGIFMAKGVILGVIGCVTTLPSMILVLDKLLQKTSHKSLLPDMGKVASGITKVFPVFLILFLGLVLPSYLSYKATNNEVYYDLGETLPEDMAYVVANSKLQEDFGVGATHMVLVSTDVSDTDVRAMIHEMENVEGIKYALGLESVVGPLVPEEMLPESVKEVLKSDDWELLLVNSEYKTATDEVNAQINELNTILKKYDSKGMLIGEAPCTKDLIETTDEDFKVVNTVSIVAIFVIIALVEKSITLPLILVAVIELSIFINLGLAHLTGTSLPFIAPICISTIQLGATVDYAILMTTRYKQERYEGRDKREAVTNALKVSIPSIIVSAMGLFSATFGVALYSDVDIISSLCDLMARGAIVSMFAVILFLPAMFMLFDKVICVTSIGFRNKNAEPSNTLKERTA